MDISVFNLLMSTTPNVPDMEAPVVDARASAVQTQDSLRTGEAFLEVLDQVRSGKTEKSAETFFNTMSARADASSSLKNFKTNEKYGENVKVVKLHIKRTRASEKLQKAEEKTTSTPETVQNRQKIPNKENIAATQETETIVYEDNNVRTVDDPSFTPVTDVSNQTAPERDAPVFSDELTAADILVGIALQTTAVQETNIQPQTDDVARPVAKEREQRLPPAEQTELPQIAKNNETTDIPTKKTPAPQIQKNEPVAEQHVSLSQNKETFSLPVDLETNDFSPVERLNVQNPENDFIPFKENDTRQDLPAPVSVEKTTEEALVRERHVLKEHTSTVGPTDVSTDLSVETEDLASASKSESRRQADHLAAALPTDTKIAITVETSKPTVSAFRPVRLSNDKDTTERKIATEKNTETPLFEASHSDLPQDEGISTRPVESQTASDDSVKPQTERQPTQNLTNNMIALPVEQKSFSDTTQISGATGSSNGAVSTSATNTPTGQAFIPAGQELKGKAVSGTVALQKHVPVNELADQIKINIKKAVKAGLDKIDVVLKHKDLGTIKVHLEIDKEGNMKAVLSTARTETLDLLRSDLQGLKQALADGGFNMNDESFSFNYRGERYDDEQKQAKRHHTDNIAANDDEEENYLQPISATDHSGRSALNIRV